VTNLAAGASIPVRIDVRVSDCVLAAPGQIQGVLLTPNGGFGVDFGLIRALDRLVYVGCPR
jgi:hypothetical protein